MPLQQVHTAPHKPGRRFVLSLSILFFLPMPFSLNGRQHPAEVREDSSNCSVSGQQQGQLREHECIVIVGSAFLWKRADANSDAGNTLLPIKYHLTSLLPADKKMYQVKCILNSLMTLTVSRVLAQLSVMHSSVCNSRFIISMQSTQVRRDETQETVWDKAKCDLPPPPFFHRVP